MSDYTLSSGAYFNDDGSCGIGVECFFEQGYPSRATKSWPLNVPVNAVELWGGAAMRTSGAEADVLIGVFLDGREVWGTILKAGNGTVNQWTHCPPIALKTPATVLRIDMEAAGSGDAWNPLNCEIRLCGRWE